MPKPKIARKPLISGLFLALLAFVVSHYLVSTRLSHLLPESDNHLVAEVEHSATYYAAQYRAEHLFDQSTEERAEAIDYWILPDGTTGEITITLNTATDFDSIRLLNTRNGPHQDRMTDDFSIDLYHGAEVVFSRQGKMNPYPQWTEVEFTPSVEGVTSLVVSIDSYRGAGGGLNEIQLNPRDPGTLRFWLTLGLWLVLLAILFLAKKYRLAETAMCILQPFSAFRPYAVGTLVFFAALLGIEWNSTLLSENELTLMKITLALALGAVGFRIATDWQRIFRPTLGIWMIALVAIAINLTPYYLMNGWPLNHEGLAWKMRTIVWAQHLYHLDLIPIWSSSDAYGMGSPILAYYHKLFYYLSGFIYLVGGSVLIALLIATGAFYSIGMAGMYACFRRFELNRYSSVLLAACLIYMSYTVSNVSVRGAFSEFSAMMLVPWVVYWCIRVLQDRRWNYWIVPILFLLFLAHTIILYYSMLILVATGAAFVLDRKIAVAGKLDFVKRATAGAGLLTLLIGIYLVPWFGLSEHYDVSSIRLRGFTPEFQLPRWIEYFFYENFAWYSLGHIDYRINPPIFIFPLVALLYIGHAWLTDTSGKHQSLLRETRQITYPVLLVVGMLIFFYLLNTRFGLPFYARVPCADYIQFPWRLLTFISVFYLLLTGLTLRLVEKLSGVELPILPLLVFAMLVFYYPMFHYKNVNGHFTSKDLAYEPGDPVGVTGIGEYYPVFPERNGLIQRNKIHQHFQDLARRGVEFVDTAHSRDDVALLEQDPLEPRYALYRVRLTTPLTVILPYNHSGMETAEVMYSSAKGQAVPVFRTADDPRMRVALPEGTYRMKISFPTYGAALRKLFTAFSGG